jgi:hypothetical protein
MPLVPRIAQPLSPPYLPHTTRKRAELACRRGARHLHARAAAGVAVFGGAAQMGGSSGAQ